MKKGCFIKLIIILTIITAVIVYLVQNHFDELVLNPGKNFLKNIVISGLDEEIDHVKDKEMKDSINVMVSSFLDNELKYSHEFNDREYDWLIDSLRIIADDSIVTYSELESFNLLLNRNKSNERSKEN